jgi:hypothetical protein
MNNVLAEELLERVLGFPDVYDAPATFNRMRHVRDKAWRSAVQWCKRVEYLAIALERLPVNLGLHQDRHIHSLGALGERAGRRRRVACPDRYLWSQGAFAQSCRFATVPCGSPRFAWSPLPTPKRSFNRARYSKRPPPELSLWLTTFAKPTLTYDQGAEMVQHATLSKRRQMDVYFCEPHSPWQRGTNQHANGMIREFLPKDMGLRAVTAQQLTAIEHSLNNRPRKILGFLTQAEVFEQLKLNHIAGVAPQA